MSIASLRGALLITLAGTAVFFAGFFVGHRASPAAVLTKDKIAETTKTADVAKKVAETHQDLTKDVANDVDRTVTRFPDGRVEEHTVDRTKTEAHKVEVRTVVQERVVVQEHVRVEEHEKLVLRRPDWILGVNAGLSVPSLLGHPTTSYLPFDLSRSAVFGVSVERRVLGGTYLGLNANSQGVVGLGLRVTF